MQSHFLYGAILSVSLLGAFLTWTEEPDPISGDEIELLSGKKDDLQEIEWNSPKNFVRISKKEKNENNGNCIIENAFAEDGIVQVEVHPQFLENC